MSKYQQLYSKFGNRLIYSVMLVGAISLLVNIYLIHTYNVLDDLKVKAGICKPPIESENWAVRAWTNTLMKMNYEADVVFFGNSITYDSEFEKAFPSCRIVNLGYPGDNIEGMMKRVD